MLKRLKEIPSRVYIRYGLLTIPGTVVLILILIIVQNWVPMPLWLRAALIVLWIAKEVILFPFTWRAYDHARPEVFHPMVGLRGITKERLAPIGYILVQGERWKAEKMFGEHPIEKNTWVRVKKIEGLKLFVVPEVAEGNEVGNRNAEVGKIGQEAGGRGQGAEGRRQRTEGRRQRTDDRNWKSAGDQFIRVDCGRRHPLNR